MSKNKYIKKKTFDKTIGALERNNAVLHQNGLKVTNTSTKAVYNMSRNADLSLMTATVGLCADIAKHGGEISKKKFKKSVAKNFKPFAHIMSKNSKKKLVKAINNATSIASIPDKQLKAVGAKKPIEKMGRIIDKSFSKVDGLSFTKSLDDVKIDKKNFAKKLEKDNEKTVDDIKKILRDISSNDENSKKDDVKSYESLITTVSSGSNRNNKKKKKKNSKSYDSSFLGNGDMPFVNE